MPTIQQLYLPFYAARKDLPVSRDLASVSRHNRTLAWSILPRPLHTSAEAKIGNFLAFHDSFACAGHYFWFADLNRFCDRGLLELTKDSTSLRYAVAAYSSMLFSVYNPSRGARTLAFTYYAEALRSVNETIAASPSADSSIFGVLPAVLELTTFEVRHLFCPKHLTCSVFSENPGNPFGIFKARRKYYKAFRPRNYTQTG